MTPGRIRLPSVRYRGGRFDQVRSQRISQLLQFWRDVLKGLQVGRLDGFDEGGEDGQPGKGIRQSHQIAPVGSTGTRASGEAFQVVDLLELLLERRAEGTVIDQFLEGGLAIANLVHRQQRLQQPAAQRPSAHRRYGAIKGPE